MEHIRPSYDLVIVGGGVTGAGILREAVRMGLDTLLVEQHDFAWGTSSRSSKLVHGGLRYLKQGNIHLVLESIRERERLLKESPGLVEPIQFLMLTYKGMGPGKRIIEAGLAIYNLLALKWGFKSSKPDAIIDILPFVEPQDLTGGLSYYDAQVDDARLVLKLIDEAETHGGTALNYTKATKITRDEDGNVKGMTIQDTESEKTKNIETKLVINATGAFAERLHPSPKNNLHIRPLKGSHLIFPKNKIPIDRAVSFFHPDDQRPLFAIPWEGAVIYGTTDLDNDRDLSAEPKISLSEAEYLMDGIRYVFPGLDLRMKDCISTMCGVRPVLSKGDRDPSGESREHAIWIDRGLLTITGGKLTTFRKLAVDTLKKAEPFCRKKTRILENEPVFRPSLPYGRKHFGITPATWRRLTGRYGVKAESIIANAKREDLEVIPGTNSIWAELPHVAQEHVRHLTDIMLRRLRIGILSKNGALEHIPRIRTLCEPKLSWDDAKWKEEIKQYVEFQHRYIDPQSIFSECVDR